MLSIAICNPKLHFLLIICWILLLYWWCCQLRFATLCCTSCWYVDYYNCTDGVVNCDLQPYVALLVDHMLIITTVLMGVVNCDLQPYVVLLVDQMLIITTVLMGVVNCICNPIMHFLLIICSVLQLYWWVLSTAICNPMLHFLLIICWLLQLYWWVLSTAICNPMLHFLLIICWLLQLYWWCCQLRFATLCCTSCWSYVGYYNRTDGVGNCDCQPYVALLVGHILIITTVLMGVVNCDLQPYVALLVDHMLIITTVLMVLSIAICNPILHFLLIICWLLQLYWWCCQLRFATLCCTSCWSYIITNVLIGFSIGAF